jgi:sulfite reductase (NADPH) hemoprotein beta-component
VRVGLAVGNNDLLGDMICCPGLDYCNLANARSIPIAKEIAKRFEDPKRQELIGPLRLNMSGCINACGHHHAGNIGILGVDKKGTELYQISLGGSPKDDAAIGTIIGPGFRAEAVPQAIDTIIETYLANRTGGEDFLATWRRIGPAPFKEALYGAV